MITRKGFLNLGVSLLASTILIGCNNSNTANPASGDNDDHILFRESAFVTELDAIPPGEISPEERASLVFLREEEKLARDVYTAMYAQWGHQVFWNISCSEETHMNAVLTLLNRYSIPDPVGGNGAGVFTDEDLQQLYDQLVSRGTTSLLEALKVGILIEETDIVDLKDGLAVVDNRDIIFVYNNLLSGSQSHLEAFTRILTRY